MELAGIEQQRHGYIGGHQLLASSILLPREDQDVVDRLSDIGGQPGPNETVPDYLTGYPLPSGQHFAFARTWYDPTAPRSGCVVTHTLLVPSGFWSSVPSVLSLARLHALFERERAGRALPTLASPPPLRVAYPPVSAGGLAELCEAVFLEGRRPVVWFTEPDDQTALRLVEALWPAMRARFAFQTYALKPRSKAVGPFDLMVAPRSARGRFSVWEGRRVEGDAPARHQFTPLLVSSVFGSPLPDLEAADPLGVLSDDKVGDASRLRLSFLWRSMAHAGGDDPKASLGMLDILTAASLSGEERWRRAEPLFRRALSGAATREGRKANLLALTLGKLERGDTARLGSAVADAVAALARVDAKAASRLAAATWRDVEAVDSVRGSFARAIAAMQPERAWAVLADASPDLATGLIEREPQILVGLAGRRGGAPEDWTHLALIVNGLDDAAVAAARGDALVRLARSEQAPVLESLLAGLYGSDLVEAVRRLDRGGAFADQGLLEAFAELDDPGRKERLDAVASAQLPAAHIRAILAALLSPTKADVAWLLSSPIPDRVRAELLRDFVLAADASTLRRMGILDGPELEGALSALLAHEAGVPGAAFLVSEAVDLTDAAFNIALAAFGGPGRHASPEIVASLIARSTPLAGKTDVERLEQLLACAVGADALPLAAPSVVDLLLSEDARDLERSYSLGLEVAARLRDSPRDLFLAGLPAVAEKLRSYRVYRLTAGAYRTWSELVTEAVSKGGEIGDAAAASALAYALRCDWDGVLPLVDAAFPTVYDDISERGKARDAFRLARDVCRLFVSYRWDSEVFLRMLLATRDSPTVVAAMTDCWGGTDYLRHALERAGHRMSKKELSAQDPSRWHIGSNGRLAVAKR